MWDIGSDIDVVMAQTLLYMIEPEDDSLIVLPASAVDDLTANAKATAFLWDATWSQIRWGRDKLSPDIRERVDATLDWTLESEWDELHLDDPESPERPADWLPSDGEHPDAGFSDDWREMQGAPIDRRNGLPPEILRLGQGPGRPGAGDWVFFVADQLDEIRAAAEALGMNLVHDEVAIMRCWAEVWADKYPGADAYVDDDWRQFSDALWRQ